MSVVHNKKINLRTNNRGIQMKKKTVKKGPKTKRHSKTILLSQDITIHMVNQSRQNNLKRNLTSVTHTKSPP